MLILFTKSKRSTSQINSKQVMQEVIDYHRIDGVHICHAHTRSTDS